MNYNFVEGSIAKKLIRFTMPILLALFLQMLYGAVDLLIVGNFATSADVSAVSIGFQFISVFINLIAGISMGTTIIIGQKIGAKKSEDLGEVIGAGIFLFFIIAIALTFLIGLNGDFFTSMLNAPDESFAKTSQYIRVLAYGSIFLVSYNVLGSIFRGLGDSTTPLIAVIIATVINIILDYILVHIYDMGAYGAAVATVIAQAIAVLFSLFIIMRHEQIFTLKFKDISYSKKYTKETLNLGSPVAINAFLVSLSFTFVLAVVNRLGVYSSAGVGVTERLISFLMLIPLAFSQSIASFVAQNVGAKQHKRASEGMKITIMISLVFAFISMFIALFEGPFLLSFFTKDPNVLPPAFEYLKAYCFDIIFTAFLFPTIGYFNGYGKTKFTLISGTLGAILFRIPLSYLLSLVTPTSIFLIGLGTPTGTIFQLTLTFFYYRHIQKQIRNNKL
ncbi:MAG: MATE family efflux transporter [Sphaerochaetaceae bacterium]|nr:MATE family efflux transporter [Sphaerochaetaceae bacterium]